MPHNAHAEHGRLVVEILEDLGARPDIMIWRQPTGRFRTFRGAGVVNIGAPGRPDIGGVVSVEGLGLAFAIECKTRSGRQTSSQRYFAANWARLGGLYILARSLQDARLCLGDGPGQRTLADIRRQIEENRHELADTIERCGASARG